MGTVIVAVFLAVVVFFALKSSLPHFKGEGGCCGGCGEKPEKKKLKGKKIAEKVIHIEGMHCERCKNSVESAINRLEGAVAHVSLKKNLAVVKMSRMIPDEDLRLAVEGADFKVTGIEKRQ